MPRPLSKVRQQKQLLNAVRQADLKGVESFCTYAEPVGSQVVGLALGQPHNVCLDILKMVLPHLNQRTRQHAFKHAAAQDNMSAVELLLPMVDPTHNFSEALRMAVTENHVGMVKRLLPISDQSALNYMAIGDAAKRYNWEVFRTLFQFDPAVLPKTVVEEIVHASVADEQPDIMKIFLPMSVREINPWYILCAAENGRKDIVDILHSYTDLTYLPEMLQVSYERHQISQEDYDYLAHYSDYQTHKKIAQQVDQLGKTSLRRKI